MKRYIARHILMAKLAALALGALCLLQAPIRAQGMTGVIAKEEFMKHSAIHYCLLVLLVGLIALSGSRTIASETMSSTAISGMASRQFRAPRSDAINQSFNVGGVERAAIIYPNKKNSSKTGAPLVLGFHGHGGRAEFVARKWRLSALWPEAVVIYLQGLPTATPRDPDGGRPGWQIAPGDQNDRDVRFVDAVIEWARKQYKIDPDRIYAIGHSNGARFANVLWKTRGEKFAAFCSAAAQGGLMIRDATPRSIFAIAGENDRIVRYDGQVRSIEVYRRVLKTDSSKAVTKGYAKIEPGINGTELVTYLHPGGHEFPQDALPLVVEFFKRHSRK